MQHLEDSGAAARPACDKMNVTEPAVPTHPIFAICFYFFILKLQLYPAADILAFRVLVSSRTVPLWHGGPELMPC